MELEINKDNKKENHEINEFANLLENEIEKNRFDNENFINQLGVKFSISKEDLKEAQNKIDDFLKDVDSNVGEVMYITYDKEKDKFYEKLYFDKKIKLIELFDEEAKSRGVGRFYISLNNKRHNDNVLYRDANFIKTDIKNAIKSQLKKGTTIKNIDFSQLKEKYQDKEYIKKIYQKCYS